MLTYRNLESDPVNFVTPGNAAAADIIVNDGSVLQSMVGYGATLSASPSCFDTANFQAMNVTSAADSSAQLLNNLKVRSINLVHPPPS